MLKWNDGTPECCFEWISVNMYAGTLVRVAAAADDGLTNSPDTPSAIWNTPKGSTSLPLPKVRQG